MGMNTKSNIVNTDKKDDNQNKGRRIVVEKYPFKKKFGIFITALFIGILISSLYTGYKWYKEHEISLRRAVKYNHVIKQIPEEMLKDSMKVEFGNEVNELANN